ncbi:MAG: hypothetical protein IKW83_07275 [Muribaculaceae bacterium]|nr:hypothetical protein [Muribaculaceae bacterium]
MKQESKDRIRIRLFAILSVIVVAFLVVLCYAIPIGEDDSHKATASVQRVKVRGGGGGLNASYRFKDVNDTQIVAAQQFGIEPLSTRDGVDSIAYQLIKIESSNAFKVDSLTHSVPYLTPSASELLNIIAANFQSKLQEQGFAQYQFIVTSLLRTSDDVRKLRRVNRNAVKNSCHMYGTTFDIAYNCFEKVDSLPDFEGADASYKVLVNTLGETLKELRDANRCYIMFERGQPCYHITTRQ